MSDLTQLLGAIDNGDRQAAEELLPLVHDELRKLATSKMAHAKLGQTLQPTALVHEAWLKIGGEGPGTSPIDRISSRPPRMRCRRFSLISPGANSGSNTVPT